MWPRVLVLMVLCAGVALAGNAGEGAVPAQTPASAALGQVNTDAKVLRQGIVDYQFDPEDGSIVLRVLGPDAKRALSVDGLEVTAIGDELERGRSIRAELARLDASTFRGTLNLSEGAWNLSLRVTRGERVLQGQYLLGVGKSVTAGRMPLVPPNPEVGRLTSLFALLLGVPVGLGVLVTLIAVLTKGARGRKPAASA